MEIQAQIKERERTEIVNTTGLAKPRSAEGEKAEEWEARVDGIWRKIWDTEEIDKDIDARRERLEDALERTMREANKQWYKEHEGKKWRISGTRREGTKLEKRTINPKRSGTDQECC